MTYLLTSKATMHNYSEAVPKRRASLRKTLTTYAQARDITQVIKLAHIRTQRAGMKEADDPSNSS